MRSLLLGILLWIPAPMSPAQAEPSAPAETIRLFSTLAFRESPYADFAGVVPLTAEQAAARNHYRFVYDQEGRIREISFRLGTRLRTPNHTANYFFRSSIVRIAYRDHEEVRRFFDHRELPVTVLGEVFEERYDLDDRGRRRELRFVDVHGEPVESAWGMASYHWRTEPDGTVVEWRKALDGKPVSMRPGLAFGVLGLHYDARGQIALMQNLDRNGALLDNATGVSQDRLSFDASGRFLGWAVLDAAGRPRRGNGPDVARGVVTPDRWGYESEIRFEDERGEAIRNGYGWGGSRTAYDRYGNWRSRAFVDADGSPMNVERLGYHRYDFEWDASGLLMLSMRYVDVEGRPVAHRERGYAVVRHDHDRQGNRIASRFLRVDGTPVDRIDSGVASIDRTFDERGRLLEVRYHDAQGAPTVDRRSGHAGLRYRYGDRGEPLGPQPLSVTGELLDGVDP